MSCLRVYAHGPRLFGLLREELTYVSTSTSCCVLPTFGSPQWYSGDYCILDFSERGCYGSDACRADACALKNKTGQQPRSAKRCTTRLPAGSPRGACTMTQRRLDAIMAPRARALLASATCWVCCCPMGMSGPSGVPGAAGWGHDRQRGHEQATTSWARFGRGRWELLIEARARRRHR